MGKCPGGGEFGGVEKVWIRSGALASDQFSVVWRVNIRSVGESVVEVDVSGASSGIVCKM